MIRTVAIPRTAGRLAQTLEQSMGCIAYQDPTTGLWTADANTAAMCTPGDGSSSAAPLVADPGLNTALQEFADSTKAQSSSAALNSLMLNSPLSLSPSTHGQTNPLPGPGLGLVTVPDPLKKYLEIAAGILVAFILFAPNPNTRSRR